MVSASFVVALGALASSPLAFAQYYPQGNATSSGASPTGTGSPNGGGVVVSVGKDGLRFSPDIVEASVGTEITFEFYPKNRNTTHLPSV
jgi:plastocyanin